MDNFETIKIEKIGRVMLISIDRPSQLNALNLDVAREVLAAAEACEENDEIGCIVITGNEKAYAAGADISQMAEKTATEMVRENFFSEWDEFAALRTPKIAAVNGYALGGGCEVAMMCDFIIAGKSAKFGQPEIKLGVIAGMGGSQRMTKLIGRAKSMDMHLTGRIMLADEALECGLIARIAEDDKVVSEAIEAAELIAGYSKPVASLARDAVRLAEETSLADGVAWERKAFHNLFDTEDQKEGMRAFLEKRAPKFRD